MSPTQPAAAVGTYIITWYRRVCNIEESAWQRKSTNSIIKKEKVKKYGAAVRYISAASASNHNPMRAPDPIGYPLRNTGDQPLPQFLYKIIVPRDIPRNVTYCGVMYPTSSSSRCSSLPPSPPLRALDSVMTSMYPTMADTSALDRQPYRTNTSHAAICAVSVSFLRRSKLKIIQHAAMEYVAKHMKKLPRIRNPTNTSGGFRSRDMDVAM